MSNSYVAFFTLLALLLSGNCAIVDDVDDTQGYVNDDAKDESEAIAGPPPKLISTPQEFDVHPGETIYLPCVMENQGNGVRMWTKHANQTTLYAGDYGFLVDVYGSNKTHLIIKNVTKEQEDKYTCKLSTQTNISVTHTVKIARAATIINLTPSQERYDSKKGDNLSVYCNAEGAPKPTVQWHKKKDSGEGSQVVSNDGLLTLNSITEKDAGFYMCVASNRENNSPVTSTIQVIFQSRSSGVKFASENPVVTAGDEEFIELSCTLVGGGNKAKVEWFKNNEKIYNTGHYQLQNENGRYVLKISGIKNDDFGTYTCQATTPLEPTPLTDMVKLIGKPSKPRLTTSTLEDSNIPVLTWIVESQTSLLDYNITYIKQEDNSEKVIYEKFDNGNSSKPFTITHTFSGLSNGQYKAQLQVENKYGWSDPSDEYTFAIDNTPYSVSSPVQDEKGQGGVASHLRICFAVIFSFIIPLLLC